LKSAQQIPFTERNRNRNSLSAPNGVSDLGSESESDTLLSGGSECNAGGKNRSVAWFPNYFCFFSIANWFVPLAGLSVFGANVLARLVIYIHIFADWQSIGHGRCIWPFPGSNLVRTAYGNGFRGSRPLSAHKGDIYTWPIYTHISEYSYGHFSGRRRWTINKF